MQEALNPKGKTPEDKILGGFNAIVVRQIWLDYCNLMFSEDLITDLSVAAISGAIHRELNLMIHAERGLLVNDQSWWSKKAIFDPGVLEVEEVQKLLAKLDTRIDSFTLLLRGRVSEELESGLKEGLSSIL